VEEVEDLWVDPLRLGQDFRDPFGLVEVGDTGRQRCAQRAAGQQPGEFAP